MSIPLDRLYHYIESIAEKIRGDSILIYHFYPHGSKNINHLIPLSTSISSVKWRYSPYIICNDQEPLNFDFYAQYEGNIRPRTTYSQELNDPAIMFPEPKNIFNNVILLHSEKNSKEVVKYQSNEFIPVYYWSHALIALDWYRFAQHIKQKKNIKKRFLIYNRAWSGTREYRLHFADYLIKLDMTKSCQMTCNPIDPTLNKHYNLHDFLNPVWRPANTIEKYFSTSAASSHYSADFELTDYEATEIEVVLETLFDDSRLHLTEKSLRPIACGQPFILASTTGSLEYLRNYGFKTFSNCWDESYDLEPDPKERLIKITELMKHLDCQESGKHKRKMLQAQKIADYNKKHFFSKNFFNQVVNELKTNLTSGLIAINYTRKINWDI